MRGAFLAGTFAAAFGLAGCTGFGPSFALDPFLRQPITGQDAAMCTARAFQAEARAARRARAFERALTLAAIGREAFAAPMPDGPPPPSCACFQREAALFHRNLQARDAASVLHAPSPDERDGVAKRLAEAEAACPSPAP